MNPKEKFLERMEQAFMILIHQKDLLIGAAVIYGGIPIIMTILWKILLDIMIFDSFLNHSINYITLIIACLLWLGLIFVQIGIFLGFIKYLSDINKGLPVDLKTSMLYGIGKIWASCYTYYYIFLYTLLIPALFLIGGLILILLDLTQGKIGLVEGLHNAQYANIGLALIGISILLTIYFLIYRGIRTSFAIYRAIDKEDFSKISFEKSLHITDKQWTRIFGNLVGMGILMSLAMSIFSGIFSTGGSSLNMGNLMSMKELSGTDIKSMLLGFSSLGVGNILSNILSGIGGVFSITFTYLLFKRLEMETGEDSPTEIQESLVL